MAWLPALIVSLAVLCSRSQTPAPRTAIQGDLTSADWIDGTHPLINCTIYVSNKGSDSAAGTAASPLQTPEAAVSGNTGYIWGRRIRVACKARPWRTRGVPVHPPLTSTTHVMMKLSVSTC
jgi:hypothetical protein